MDETLNRLRRKPDYYQHDAPPWVRKIWEKPESFEWFLKNNRQALTESGALIRIGRDYFIDTGLFPDVAARLLGIAETASA